MYKIVRGTTQDLPDVTEFVELISTLEQNPLKKLRELFDTETEIYIARAPGRLDVMGGIADYSGSLVLEMPTAEATLAALQISSDRKIKIISLAENPNENLAFEMSLDDFFQDGNLVSYEAAQQLFAQNPENHWAAYVAGIFLVLMRERGVEFKNGAQILISSNVPLGKGVSSSAALEVATMQAVCAAFEIEIEARESAILCQKVENLVVGAPCGVMDQMTSACGEANRLIALLCQPAELLGIIEIPEEIAFWGIDSGVRHAVSGADYASVRVGAFMGYQIIADLAKLEVEKTNLEKIVKIQNLRWKGFLSNISPSEFEQFYAAHLPAKIYGEEFLRNYGGTTDSVTKINPEKTYAVKIPAAHAVYENFRVRCFAELLQNKINENILNLLGELMFQSNASYAACGLCESGTNKIVELVRADNSRKLYGAKITGGGSGGTVVVLGKRGSEVEIEKIKLRYEQETGLKSYIFQGSSPGSFSFGHLKLEKFK